MLVYLAECWLLPTSSDQHSDNPIGNDDSDQKEIHAADTETKLLKGKVF